MMQTLTMLQTLRAQPGIDPEKQTHWDNMINQIRLQQVAQLSGMGVASSAFNSQIKQPQNSDKLTDMLTNGSKTQKEDLKLQNEATELRSESMQPNGDQNRENTERRQALDPLDHTMQM